MRVLVLVALACVLAGAAAQSALQDTSSAQLSSAIGKKPVVVGFFLKGCPHCVRFHPVLEQFASEMRSKNPDMVVAKLSAYDPLADQLGLKGFPAVVVYAPGSSQPITYSGERSLADLEAFVSSHGLMSAGGAQTAANVQDRVHVPPHVIRSDAPSEPQQQPQQPQQPQQQQQPQPQQKPEDVPQTL